MEGLLAEINKRKATDFEDTASSSRKYVRRGDIERERDEAAKRKREEERARKEEKERKVADKTAEERARRMERDVSIVKRAG